VNTPTSTPAQRRWATALIFITPLLWSVNFVVGRLAPGQVGPHALALGRWALAGLLLAWFARHELAAAGRWTRGDVHQALILGALGMWICGAWVYIGAQTTQATNIALIYALSPVFIALGAALFLGEHLGPRQWLGAALAFGGLLHVVIRGDWAGLARLRFVPGDGWILAAAISWAVYSLLLKRWPSRFSPMARLVLIIAGGVVILLPLTAAELWVAQTQQLAGWATHWDLKTAGLVAAAALLPGAGAYLAHATITQHLGAAKAALPMYLGPVAGALMAWWVLGEPVQQHHAVGAAVILPGLWLASRRAA
jgi:drug/metabolite transporter (DMT)-like permease